MELLVVLLLLLCYSYIGLKLLFIMPSYLIFNHIKDNRLKDIKEFGNKNKKYKIVTISTYYIVNIIDYLSIKSIKYIKKTYNFSKNNKILKYFIKFYFYLNNILLLIINELFIIMNNQIKIKLKKNQIKNQSLLMEQMGMGMKMFEELNNQFTPNTLKKLEELKFNQNMNTLAFKKNFLSKMILNKKFY